MATNPRKVLPPKKVSVPRRGFISSAILGGAAISLGSPGVVAGNKRNTLDDLGSEGIPNHAPDCATGLGAIDSLNLSIQFLDPIYGRYVCPFQAAVIEKNASLVEEYKQLLRLVTQLEEQCPQLKESAAIKEIKQAVGAGTRSVANEAKLGMGLMNVSVAFVDENELLSSASTLSSQQASITLSPEAAKTLRTLLSEIRRVHDFVIGANAASLGLEKASIDAYAKIGALRSIIFETLSTLARRDKTQTLSLIDNARGKLASIDSIYTDKLKDLSDAAKKNCNNANPKGLPGEFLSDFLLGTRELIEEELASLRIFEGGAATSVRFVKASMAAGPGWSDLVELMGPVLHNTLIENTETRRESGAVAVRPFVRYRGVKRIEKFTTVLAGIVPQGVHDGDPAKLSAAATELDKLLIAKGW